MSWPDAVPVPEAERERAVSSLRQAAEEGRLGPEQLDDHLARARAARTPDELTAVLADLSAAALPRPAGIPTAAQALAALAAKGTSAEAPLVINGGVSGEKRTGDWLVPPFVRADAGVSTVRLDCRQARPGAEVIDLEVRAVAGNVVLVLPDGWAVNVDGLSKGLGSVKVRVPGIPSPGCPLIIAHGSVGMGNFVARGASRFERWLTRRRLARGGTRPALTP